MSSADEELMQALLNIHEEQRTGRPELVAMTDRTVGKAKRAA